MTNQFGACLCLLSGVVGFFPLELASNFLNFSQEGLKSYKWFQNQAGAQHEFDFKSHDLRPKLHDTKFNVYLLHPHPSPKEKYGEKNGNQPNESTIKLSCLFTWKYFSVQGGFYDFDVNIEVKAKMDKLDPVTLHHF